MKLKYIFTFLAAALGLMLTSCTEEADTFLKEVQVSSSYVAIPAEGGNVEITVNAQDAWTIEGAPDWLTISPLSGSAGEAKVKFSADAATDTRDATVKLTCLGKTQNINVIQMTEKTELPITPIATVISTASGTFRVKGVVTKVSSTTYGNFYMNDDSYTGSDFQIYGTKMDSAYPKDHPKGWAAFDIEVGDIITVEGPYSLYNTTHELVDVEIIAHEKSLIKVESVEPALLPAEGGNVEITISSKVSPIIVTTDVNWLKVSDVKEGNVYVLTAEANDYTAVRTATITVKGPGAIATTEVKQEGIPATGKSVTDIIAEADNAQVETLESTVVALTTKGAVISDGSKAIYVYGADAAARAIGDNVKVFGKKTTYNGVPEITDLTAVNVLSQGNAVTYPVAKDITPEAATYTAAEAEFIKLTGTLAKSGNYYNLTLEGLDARQGSIVYPIEALNAASFDTKKIIVTGYYNGFSGGKYINIIATKIDEADVDNGSTITEILAMEKGTAVESKASLVTALTTRGFVATDGTKSVYVYTQGTDFNGVAKIGDKVKFAGTKDVYSGMHEITPVTALDIVSSGNEVTYPAAKDITAEVESYTATEAEYISLTGTLEKSGNYFNITVDGVEANNKQGSVVYPIEALNAASFDKKKVTVTGYFNGITSKGKYINIIATKIEEASAPAAAPITIDGDMSDWASITGVTEGTHTFKATSDANNIYLYSKRANSGRYSDIWGGTGYVYFGFDLDNNSETGDGEKADWGTGKWETIILTYPYAGSADAKAIADAVGSSWWILPNTFSIGNLTFKGVVEDDGAAIEFSIPRADIATIPATEITIKAWGNKDLGTAVLQCTL